MTPEQILLFAVLGLATGAVIAGLAVSVVVTYRGSGVINIAVGAISMVAGYTYWTFDTGWAGVTLGVVGSFALALVVSLLVGLLTEFLVFRPLRTAPPLAKLVASLGLFLVAEAAMILIFSNNPRNTPAYLPGGVINMLGGVVPIEGLIVTGVVVVIAALLALAYHRTRFGLGTRAAAESEESAMLMGLSPNTFALRNTVIASLVAGAVGVLASDVTPLDPTLLPLVVIPALAAAVFARFTSFGVACIVGFAIGMLENILYLAETQSWFPKDGQVPWPGVSDLLVFLIMVIALFVRGASLPNRGEVADRQLPVVPRPRNIGRAALIGGALCVACLIAFPYGYRQALSDGLIDSMICLSLVVIIGFVGQISIVQFAISGASGFVISHLAQNFGIGFPVAPIIGVIVATALGLAVAFSALRVRGVTLAIVTLAGAVAIQNFGFGNTLWGQALYGSPVPEPRLFGIDLGVNAPFRGLDGKVPSPMAGFMILVVTILVALLVANLRTSKLGQEMLAVRSNTRAAAATGINVRNVKLTAFAIASFIAGLAGAMDAYNFGTVSADNFSALNALSLIAFAYIGGITMVSGAFMAGWVMTDSLSAYILQKWFGISGTWMILFGGICLIATLVFSPEGIMGSRYLKKERKRKLREAAAHTLREPEVSKSTAHEIPAVQ